MIIIMIVMDFMTPRRLVIILMCLGSLLIIPGIPFPIRVISSFVQAFYLPGLLFLLILWDSRYSLFDYVFFPLLISPIVLSLLVISMYAFTHSLETSLAISMSVVYASLIIALAARRKLHPSEGTHDIQPGVLLIAFILCGMVSVFYLLNPYLLVRSDATVHITIVNEIIDRGIPPTEPRLLNTPIRYMWFYHLFQACWVTLSGLSIPKALGVFNAMNAFVFPYLIARTTSFFTKKRNHTITAPLFAIAGLQAASWILWPICLLRTLFGETKGHEELVRILSAVDFNSDRVLYFLTPHWTLMIHPMDKFLTITAFNYGANLFLLCFLTILNRDFLKRSPYVASVSIFLIIVGTLLFHVVIGVVLILTVIGAGIVMYIAHVLGKSESSPRFYTMIIPVIGLLAGVIGLPYFKSLTGGGSERILFGNYVHFGLTNLITIFAPMIGLCFVVKPLLRYILFTKGLEFKVLLAWLIVLFIISIFVDLPGEAELKFNFLFFMLLIIPVSIQITDWGSSTRGFRRAFFLTWVFILFFIPFILLARGFLLCKPETEAQKQNFMPSQNRIQLYTWISKETDVNSIIIEASAENYAPVYAHRHNIMPSLVVYEMLGYENDKVKRYVAIINEIYSENPITPSSMNYLLSLRCDIYIVTWSEDLKARPYLDKKLESYQPLFKEVYENPSGKIYFLNRTAATLIEKPAHGETNALDKPPS